MNRKEEPPDKYQCLKVPIQKIIKPHPDTKTLEIINDAVMRTNYITTKSYFYYDYGYWKSIIIIKKFHLLQKTL